MTGNDRVSEGNGGKKKKMIVRERIVMPLLFPARHWEIKQT